MNDNDDDDYDDDRVWRQIHARDNAEYERGKAEAKRFLIEREIYGNELAEQWDIEREFHDPDPYY